MFLNDMFNKKTKMPAPQEALPGRARSAADVDTHFVSGRPLKGRGRKASRPRSSAWAASGGPNACSGSCRASM